MATLQVATPFTVQLEPVDPVSKEARSATTPTKYVFPEPGTYDNVPDEVAAHPYTQPHLEGYEPPPPAETADTVVMVPNPPAPEAAMVMPSRHRTPEPAAHPDPHPTHPPSNTKHG